MPNRRAASRWLAPARGAVRRERFRVSLAVGAAWATGWGGG